jgi:hypothetical protein
LANVSSSTSSAARQSAFPSYSKSIDTTDSFNTLLTALRRTMLRDDTARSAYIRNQGIARPDVGAAWDKLSDFTSEVGHGVTAKVGNAADILREKKENTILNTPSIADIATVPDISDAYYDTVEGLKSLFGRDDTERSAYIRSQGITRPDTTEAWDKVSAFTSGVGNGVTAKAGDAADMAKENKENSAQNTPNIANISIVPDISDPYYDTVEGIKGLFSQDGGVGVGTSDTNGEYDNQDGPLESAAKELVLGHYYDKVTPLGTALQILLGLTGLDAAADARDLTYDVTHWEPTGEHITQTALDAVGLLPVVGALKYSDKFKALLKNADNFTGGGKQVGGAADLARGRKLADEGEYIDGFEVVDGKVGGKIPADEFSTIRQSSIKNPDADSLTLGRYTDGPDSYIARAGTDSSYFDIGDDWVSIQEKYELSDAEMFEYFNKPALADALANGKAIRFSHDPRSVDKGFLVDEWAYIKQSLELTDDDLIKKGDFWYVQ